MTGPFGIQGLVIVPLQTPVGPEGRGQESLRDPENGEHECSQIPLQLSYGAVAGQPCRSMGPGLRTPEREVVGIGHCTTLAVLWFNNAIGDIVPLRIGDGLVLAFCNSLILEVKKYEGLHRFMDLERDLIMKAQKDAEGVSPVVSAQDVEQAENRMRELQA